MKKLVWTSLAAAVLLTGCGDQEPAKKPAENLASAPQAEAKSEATMPASKAITENTNITMPATTSTAAVAVAEPKPAAPVAFDAVAQYRSSCAACHGAMAQGQGAFPKLAGRSADELASLLNDYKAGKTKGPQSAMMMPIAAKLSADEIKALAVYLAELK